MKNILVFPCGSEIGLEVKRALNYSKHFNLIGASSVDDHGKFVYDNYIDNIPQIEDSSFIEEINKIIENYKIDFIIPAHDSVVLKMIENESVIKAKLVTSCEQTCKICRSKLKTYELFKDIVEVPKIYNQNESFEYPVFLKPEVGQGSKGTFKVNSKEELEFYRKKDSSLLILEFLPGREFTIDCFTNKDGKLLFSEGRERKRISNGISVNSEPYKNPKLYEMAKKINKKLNFRGTWFFQVKERKENDFVLMEISPRIAGTMGLFRVCGVNFIQLSIFDLMGFDVKVIKNETNIIIDRALGNRYKLQYDYDFVYVDFDDTIIFNGKVNTTMLKFLYQCKNENKKIILITKHKLDLNDILKKFSISKDIFDRIYILKNEDEKHLFITEKKSIFIDDSFQERINVHNVVKIPVFDLDSIESLIK